MMIKITSVLGAFTLVMSIGGRAQAGDHAAAGRALFEQPLAGTNGRTCATCHVLDEHTTLTPSHVERLRQTQPSDPLFARIDADDPSAAEPTYEHLSKGLVRVHLPLPDNMDVIDEEGRVVTPPDRTIFVWRGVPTVENVAYTAPYQFDGRERDLPSQAQSAITAHSEGPAISAEILQGLAAFELDVFSSWRARWVAERHAAGTPFDEIVLPEQWLPLSAAEQRGLEVFETACAGCHGNATTHQITDRAVHDALFFELDSDGYIVHDVTPEGPVARLAPRPDSEFLNIGFGLLSGYGQLGIVPMANSTVSLPRYRYRFYTDGTRCQQVTDLPPIHPSGSGAPFDPTTILDENGAPLVGPSLANQWFSTDPGRAAITGNPLDFEAFDVPQLRGIAHTAPYYHDNSAATLEEVVDNYSRFILPFPALGLPPIFPPEVEGGAPESLSPDQKADLLAFLRRL
ncbi:MAG: cytochrome c peroxidase [Polyangiales bacterium]